jgi:hypothetical protein
MCWLEAYGYNYSSRCKRYRLVIVARLPVIGWGGVTYSYVAEAAVIV